MAPMLFAGAIREGRPIKVFNHGNLSRDFTYIDDIIGDDGRPVVRRGEIRYNDPCSYRRTALSDGLTTVSYTHLDVYKRQVQYGTQADGYINYANGANIGGFMKVANAMLAQGCV